MLKKCCEYCKYYEVDYSIVCVKCRVDGGEVDYSKFESNEELNQLIEKANRCDELATELVTTATDLSEALDKIDELDKENETLKIEFKEFEKSWVHTVEVMEAIAKENEQLKADAELGMAIKWVREQGFIIYNSILDEILRKYREQKED
jgi:regulator of replication initiation timing